MRKFFSQQIEKEPVYRMKTIRWEETYCVLNTDKFNLNYYAETERSGACFSLSLAYDFVCFFHVIATQIEYVLRYLASGFYFNIFSWMNNAAARVYINLKHIEETSLVYDFRIFFASKDVSQMIEPVQLVSFSSPIFLDFLFIRFISTQSIDISTFPGYIILYVLECFSIDVI